MGARYRGDARILIRTGRLGLGSGRLGRIIQVFDEDNGPLSVDPVALDLESIQQGD